MKVSWKKGEIGTVIIGACVLGFVFGFDDKREVFELSYWLSNVMVFIGIAFIILFLYVLAQKVVAKWFNASIETRIWSLQRYGYRKGAHVGLPFPIGAVLPVVIALVSRGAVPFAGTAENIVSQKQKHRVGKEHPWVDDFDTARIMLAGPLLVTIVALVGYALSAGYPFLGRVGFVGAAVAISSMLPIPKLDGFAVFMCSAPLYVFVFAGIILSVLFIKVLSIVAAVVVSVLLALLILLLYYYRTK